MYPFFLMRIFYWKVWGAASDSSFFVFPALGRKDEEMKKEVTTKGFFIKVGDEKVPVTEEVYRAYYQGHNKEDDFSKSDIRNNVFYYAGLDSDEYTGEDLMADEVALSVEEQVLYAENIEILHRALDELTKEEREIISSIYYEGMSMREFSRKSGKALTTIQYQHMKILEKMKKFFK